PIQCDRLVVEADEGPYKGVNVPLPHSNTQYAFGCRVDMRSPSNIIKAYELISRYGLDNDQTAVAIAWAFECYEKGILTKADTDGLNLTWGNDAAVIALIRKIATRNGFGRLLGEGTRKASEVTGKGSDYYCTALKGQDNLDAIRSCKGWSLGELVSLRGGRHLDGCPTTEFFPGTPPELGEKLFGVPTAFTPTTYEGKGRLVSWFSRFKAAIDSLGVCYFTSWWLTPEFCGPEDYADALSAATGREISGDELMRIGQRIHNVEKAFNTLHAGFTRKDDVPPLIYMKEPIKHGPYKGELITQEGLDTMLDEYYETNGWDKKTSWQIKETLETLGLPEVMERLREASKLV
ncbi:MAG: aldehyde ferredoxin oxidoreductase C-terminal domain-containing protein, partial [Pseudomonadota bacterium]